MKKVIICAFISAPLLLLEGCSVLQNRSWDSEQLAAAAGNAITAVTLSDAQVAELSAQTIKSLDESNTIDNGTYQTRLNKLMSGITSVEGITLNLKVYKTDEVNAFACGDGSIRVYSGLMDVMTDEEVMAIIGHEIGHVVHKDTKKALQSAYMTAAARNVIGAAGGTIGALSQSAIGTIAESFVSAQFSQKQEYQADDYGYKFSTEHGYSQLSMYNALNKLLSLSSGSKASLVQKMFSSHPGTEERAARMKEKASSN